MAIRWAKCTYTPFLYDYIGSSPLDVRHNRRETTIGLVKQTPEVHLCECPYALSCFYSMRMNLINILTIINAVFVNDLRNLDLEQETSEPEVVTGEAIV